MLISYILCDFTQMKTTDITAFTEIKLIEWLSYCIDVKYVHFHWNILKLAVEKFVMATKM